MLAPGSTFAALRHAQFRLLWGGLIAGNMGIWMQQFMIGWIVVQIAVTEGRPELGGFYLGLRSLASAAPALGFGLLAGVLADRMDRRVLLIRTRVVSAIIAVALAAFVVSGHASLPIVIVLSAAASAAFAFDPPGRQATIPNVVPRRDLFSAMGLMRMSMQTAHTIGPVIAGLLMIPLGVGGVLLAKAGLDLASVGALVPLGPQRPHAAARGVGMLDSLRQGLAHIRRDELIRSTLGLQLVFALFGIAFVQLLPAIAVDTLHVGSIELSWLVGASGLGALGGAFLIATVGRIERRGLLLLGALACVGLLNVALGLQRELAGTLVVLVALGLLQQIFMGAQTVILQLGTPDALRGRVMSLQSVNIQSAGPLGVLAVGTLGTFIGVSSALIVAGVAAMAAATLVLLRVATLRDLRASDSAESAPSVVLGPETEGAE